MDCPDRLTVLLKALLPAADSVSYNWDSLLNSRIREMEAELLSWRREEPRVAARIILGEAACANRGRA